MTSKDITTDEVIAEDHLTPDQIRARERLMKLIEEQGARPLTIEELNSMGDLWPEDESIDEFLAALREWRSEKESRELP